MRRGRVIRMAGSIPRPPVLWVLVFHIAACRHAVETEGGWAARSAPGGAPRAHSDDGGLAQLARASALQAEGQRFESVILHSFSQGLWRSARVRPHRGKATFDILTQARL